MSFFSENIFIPTPPKKKTAESYERVDGVNKSNLVKQYLWLASKSKVISKRDDGRDGRGRSIHTGAEV